MKMLLSSVYLKILAKNLFYVKQYLQKTKENPQTTVYLLLYCRFIVALCFIIDIMLGLKGVFDFADVICKKQNSKGKRYLRRKGLDITKPIEIAEDIYWVGYNIPDDPFQCHVYLIKNGNESVLIDPGSKITYEVTRKKIMQITDLNNIKYFICHHQDPDIVSCMQDIFDEIGTKDKYIVTHWRAWALLKHYNWNVKLYEIEENAWRLKLKNRTLRFIFTPYMHFPGAFCTFDEKTNTLFSSDIFGGFTDKFELFAKNADDYFQKLKPFHEHYMPSSAIVNNGLNNIEKYKPINLIAPQHGSIIKKEYIDDIISKLRKLDCGLFGNYLNTRDVVKLSNLNTALNEIIEIVAYNENFFKVIDKIIASLNKFYRVDSVKAFTSDDNREKLIIMDSDSKNIKIINDKIKAKRVIDMANYLKEGAIFYKDSYFHSMLNLKDVCYIFPIKDKDYKSYGICSISLESRNFNVIDDLEIMRKFEVPISMAAITEKDTFLLENKSKKFYEDSIKDQLTGLFNRRYMELFLEREFKKSQRFGQILSAIMFDIDHFKKINDTYSHQVGDLVLQNIAKTIKNNTRAIDIAIRYGGEEFLLILPNTNKKGAMTAAENIRKTVENMTIQTSDYKINCTISGGVASTEEDIQNINHLILTADKNLYIAKNSGRNRIVG